MDKRRRRLDNRHLLCRQRRHSLSQRPQRQEATWPPQVRGRYYNKTPFPLRPRALPDDIDYVHGRGERDQGRQALLGE